MALHLSMFNYGRMPATSRPHLSQAGVQRQRHDVEEAHLAPADALLAAVHQRRHRQTGCALAVTLQARTFTTESPF
jgi:hypothetical protein